MRAAYLLSCVTDAGWADALWRSWLCCWCWLRRLVPVTIPVRLRSSLKGRTGALQRAGAHLCAWGRRPQSPTQRWLQSCCVRVLLPGSKLNGADADAIADSAAAEFLGLLRR
jgi:hypothetical protein